MEINKQIGFSADGTHRYWLLRSWEDNPKMLLVIGLNPSTADAENDDPTIRSVIRLAKYNGFGGFIMCNLFTYITSNPTTLRANLGTANDRVSHETLRRMIANTSTAVCAWGSWPFIRHRVDTVLELLDEPYCFGRNADGSPKHPLYIKTETLISPY